MKNFLFLTALISLCFWSLNTRATDRIVQEYGIAPIYPSIDSAIHSAIDGDRIIIINRAGGLPWVETDTITKSLTFLPYQDDSFYTVQGNWYIAPTTSKTITIVGLNIANNVQALTVPTGARTLVNIINSRIGLVDIQENNYNLLVSDCVINGGISYEYGTIMGDSIISGGITVYSESSSSGDTAFIIGNKLYNGNITFESTTRNFDIRNNYVVGSITITGALSGSTINKIYNNTVNATGCPTYGINSGSANTDIQNNIVYSCGNYSIFSNNGLTTCTYNYANKSITGAYTLNLDNTITGSLTLGVDGVTGTGVNGGNPGPYYYDLDLTVNDAGAYGGSFSLKNYFPLSPNAAQVLVTPGNFTFYIRSGNTINVQGTAFER